MIRLSFDEGDRGYDDFVWQMRSGGPMHAYDVVEGPLLRSVKGFMKGTAAVTTGSQISFRTATAVALLDQFLLP